MNKANPIMSAARAKAKEQGLVRYQPHVPCRNGHTSLRYTSYNHCIECQDNWRRKNRKSVNEKSNEWQKRNREHMREYHRKWREKNPERWAELQARLKQNQKTKNNKAQKNASPNK